MSSFNRLDRVTIRGSRRRARCPVGKPCRMVVPAIPDTVGNEVPQPANPYASASPAPVRVPTREPVCAGRFRAERPAGPTTTRDDPGRQRSGDHDGFPRRTACCWRRRCAPSSVVSSARWAGVSGGRCWAGCWPDRSRSGWSPVFVAVDTERKTATVPRAPVRQGCGGWSHRGRRCRGSPDGVAVGFWVGQL